MAVETIGKGWNAFDTLTYLTRKELVTLGAGVVAMAGFAAGVGFAAHAQEVGISRSLTAELEAALPAFDHLQDGQGETPQTMFDESKTADVVLENGATCTVVYATHNEGDWTLGLFDNRADLLSTGDCPQ